MLTLADPPAELLPGLEACNLRCLRPLHGDEHAIAHRVVMERRSSLCPTPPTLAAQQRASRALHSFALLAALLLPVFGALLGRERPAIAR
jgi:hypothetical protein